MASEPLPMAQQGAQRWLRKDGLQERFCQLSAEAPAGGWRQAASAGGESSSPSASGSIKSAKRRWARIHGFAERSSKPGGSFKPIRL